MNDFLQRLRERKLVQWALAYLAAAWVTLQVLGLAADSFDWPHGFMRIAFAVIAIGFLVALVLAWYHGERGVQRASGTELLILALLLAIGGCLLWRFAPTTSSATTSKPVTATTNAPAAAIPAKSIAVLPFENLSTDKGNAYFADGMQDLILTKLALIGDLKVISRTSTAKYASHPDDLKTIGQQLGVATILEGSVQKAGNEVLINVQLIDARTDSHVWAQDYTRTLDNVFGVESEVAQSVADALHAALTRDQKVALARLPTENTAAMQAYLQALELSRSDYGAPSTGLQQVVDHLRTAVEIDPDFTLAWTELMSRELDIYWFGFDPTQTRLDSVKAALDRAERLGLDLPQVKLARADYMYRVQLDFTGALALIREVLPKVPNDAMAWRYAALAERRLGQWDASMRDMQHAQALDPLNVQIKSEIGNSLLAQHDYVALLATAKADFSAHPDAVGAQEFRIFSIWNLEGLEAADGVLASIHSQSAAVLGLRAQQAMYRHDFKPAADLFAQAIADRNAHDHHSEFFVGAYLPARVGWRLWQALSERRAGVDAPAAAIYRQVQSEARAALAAKPVDRYVAAAWHSVLGLACAGLGERAEAVGEGKQATFLIPESKDAFEGPLWLDYLAQIHAMNGEAAQAVPLIEHLLQTNGSQTTPALLRFDPTWDPIRDDPAFQALLKKYANGQPATAASDGANAPYSANGSSTETKGNR